MSDHQSGMIWHEVCLVNNGGEKNDKIHIKNL